VVAGAADEIVQAIAFASEDDYGIGREIVPVVTGSSALIEPYAPEVLLFELFEGADKVDHAGDADVFGGSGGGFHGGGADWGGAALGEEDAVDSGGIGSAEERAEILGVFDAVEGEQKAGFGSSEKVFEVEELARTNNGNNSLVAGGFGQPGELFFGLEAQADGLFAGCVDDFLQALVVPV
jgi:hypothetical protein